MLNIDCVGHKSISNSETLLRRYVESHDDDTFDEIVKQYRLVVYQTALSQTSNADLAEDVTQAVFILLSRKAESLARHTSVLGWLCISTRLTARNVMRNESARSHFEAKAGRETIMHAINDVADAGIYAAQLVDALSRLSNAERDAVLLRHL
jgi:DNA-directed RNA polymerase specialized sigma24 family protein